MRKIILVTMALLSVSSAHAGIFEYYLGEETNSNAITDSQADVVEQIHVDISPASHSQSYDYYPTSRYSGGISNEVYYRYPHQTYDSDTYIGNGYYIYSDLEQRLEDESYRLDRELDDIEDEKEDIKDELRDIRDYNSPYYRELEERLEDELQYLQEREEYLEDLQEDVKDALKDLRKSKSYTSNRYYYSGYVYRPYDYYYDDDYYYYYDRDYYDRDYDDHYDYYSDYYYHDDYRYYRKPIWVNPYLPEVKEGRIYIK